MDSHSSTKKLPPLFSELSFKEPDFDEYLGVATEFIESVAPSLFGEIREKLAYDVTRRQLGLATNGQMNTEFSDPLLQLNKSWEWPELVKIAPFNINFPGGHRIRHLWSSEQWHARAKAEEIRRYTGQWTLTNWAFSAPMTQVRSWRDTFLPLREKRGTKFAIMMDLTHAPGFAEAAERAFKAWCDDQYQEADDLQRQSETKPIAEHLSWLADMTQCRLDAYHSMFNSVEGPEAFAAFVQYQVNAARKGAFRDRKLINEEIKDSLQVLTRLSMITASEIEIAKEILTKTIESMERIVRSPGLLEEILSQYKPTKLVVTKPCKVCESGFKPRGKVSVGHRKLAPYNLLCSCSGLRWRAKCYSGDEHEWDFTHAFHRNLQRWAVSALVGLDGPSIDVFKLHARAWSIDFDRRWEEEHPTTCRVGRS